MRSSIAPVFLLPFLGACTVPFQYEAVSQETQQAAPRPSATGAVTTSAGTSVAAPAAQDTDYSLTSLYLNAHADFQHKARPYTFLHKADPFSMPLRASFLLQSKTEVQNESGNLEWQSYNLNALVPIPVDRDVAILLGGNFECRDYDYSGNFTGALQDERYYRIDLQLGATWFVDDALSVTGMFSPGLYSDLDGTLNHNDYYFFGSLLGTYKASDDLYYKVGVTIDETIDDLPVYPLLGLSYLLTKEWRLDILLPKGATVSWLAGEQTTVSAGLELTGAAYNIRTPPQAGTKIETENRVQELSFFVGADHRLTEQLTAFGRFGTLLGGDYDIRYNGGPNPTDGQIEPAVFFEVGVGWKF